MATKTKKPPTAQKHFDTAVLFQSLVNPYIVFDVDDPTFTILEENEAHARVAMVKRSNVVGRPLLDVFPDTSERYRKSGVSELLESIRKVIRTGKSDPMPLLSYDLKDPSGTLKTMYWSVTHHPILDKDKSVIAVYQDTHDITDETLLSRELKHAQHTLQQILESSSVGTWTWNIPEGKIYTDDNLAAMFGINPQEASEGLPLDRFVESVHPDDQERVQKEVAKAFESLAPYETEYRTITRNQEVRWVIVRGSFALNSAGEAETFSGIIFDITDRKRSELAYRESENRMTFMADSMPQLVWITRADGYNEYYNRQWYDYTGTKPGGTDGDGWSNFIHPEDQARAWQVWRQSLKSGTPYEIEYRLYHAPSKTYRWVIGRALPFRDESGTIVKWYGTCTDIHEQKHSAEIQKFLADVSKALSVSLDYRSMLKTVTQLCVPIVADWSTIDLYSEDKGFEQVSVAHADQGKVKQARAYRKHNPIHIDDPTGVPQVVRTGQSEYYPYITDEMLEQFIPNDPERLAFMKSLKLHSVIIAPLRIKDEVVGGLSFVSSDSGRYYTEGDLEMAEELAARISLTLTNSRLYADSLATIKERKLLQKELIIEKQKLESRVKERTHQLQLTNEGLRQEIAKRHAIEQELQAYGEDLARSNAELEDFAYVASHDLQEPLRKIQAFSNLLKTEYGDALGDGADYVNRMHAAAVRMSTLIQDLLAFSRVSRKMEKTRSVALDEIVEDVLYDLETTIDESGGKIVVGKLPSVIADPTHMRQLFQNLIGNGLKFHKPGTQPMIEINARTKDKIWTEIRFKDNGIGFDEKYLDRIFSVFQRLHGRDTYDGTGIGLAVCRKIAEQYGGTITAESSKNKGATFIVKLPKVKEK